MYSCMNIVIHAAKYLNMLFPITTSNNLLFGNADCQYTDSIKVCTNEIIPM